MFKQLKIILFLFVLGIPLFSFAQLDSQPRNLPKYDHQPIHFGFTLGFNSSNFVINRTGNLKTRDTIYTVESQSVAGLNLGIISNLRLGEYFDLRFIPTLSFGQRNLNYHFIYHDSLESHPQKKIESTYLEF